MNGATEVNDHPVDLLPEYVRGGLPSTVEVERHLAGCESCRLEVELLRVLAAPIEAPLSDVERARIYRAASAARSAASGGTAGSAWLRATWRIAAAIALLFTSVGVWRVVQTGGSGEWDPELAMEGWAQDLADIDLSEGDLRLALGAGLIDDPALAVGWDDAALDPAEITVPWEER